MMNLNRILRSPFMRATSAFLIILLIGAVFNADGTFFKWSTHRDTLRQSSVYGILACGMTVVIITAGIDLSVGSVLGLVAVLFSIFTIHWQYPAWIAVPICLLVGTACGLVSGTLIARFAIQPFIVTLAMMEFARGLAKYISGGEKISNYLMQEDGSFKQLPMPRIFEYLDSRILGGNVAVVTIVFLVCLVVTWIILSRLYRGRHIFAVGGSENAAHLSGVPVAITKLIAYGICGFYSAVAGICQAVQERQGDPEAGRGYELTAIAIVVIGGTSLMGGQGSILLTFLGTLTIGYLVKILSINAVTEAGRLMLTGAIIIAAVLLQQHRRHG